MRAVSHINAGSGAAITTSRVCFDTSEFNSFDGTLTDQWLQITSTKSGLSRLLPKGWGQRAGYHQILPRYAGTLQARPTCHLVNRRSSLT